MIDPVLEVGDKAVVLHRGEPTAILTVTSVAMRRKTPIATLSDGSTWEANGFGSERPHKQWSQSHIERATPKHRARLRRLLNERRAGDLDREVIEKLSDADLETIVEIVRRHFAPKLEGDG